MGKAAQKVESLESQLEDTKRLLEKLIMDAAKTLSFTK